MVMRMKEDKCSTYSALVWLKGRGGVIDLEGCSEPNFYSTIPGFLVVETGSGTAFFNADALEAIVFEEEDN